MQGQGRLGDLDNRNSFTVYEWILKQADRSQTCLVCVVQLEVRVQMNSDRNSTQEGLAEKRTDGHMPFL